MLTDLNNTIKQLLVKRIPLDPDEVEVSFECPKREWSSKILKPTVNVYLFDLREDVERRETDWMVDRSQTGKTGRRRPPVYVSLSYFITTWAREVLDEHLLLWRCLTALMRELSMGEDLLQGSLKGMGRHIRTSTAQADGVLRNPGEFWSALDNDLKPAVIYSATLPVELDVLIQTPLVLTKVVRISDIGLDRTQTQFAVGGAVRTRSAKKGGAQTFVSGAHVIFPNLGISVRSDVEGRFAVRDVPPGRHRVRVVSLAGGVAESEIEVPGSSYDLEV